MFVVVTPENNHRGEFDFLEQFVTFPNVRVHIRKPHATQEQMLNYLARLSRKVLEESSLHSWYELAGEFNLGGVHFTESMRAKLGKTLLQNISKRHNEGKKVSASLHDLKDVEAGWDYVFLSPVFDSVSKSDYRGKEFSVKNVPQEIIALGGVTADNIGKARELGYAGVATLGSLWQYKDPSEAFYKLYDSYEKYFT